MVRLVGIRYCRIPAQEVHVMMPNQALQWTRRKRRAPELGR
jgi:hypothetical protein